MHGHLARRGHANARAVTADADDVNLDAVAYDNRLAFLARYYEHASVQTMIGVELVVPGKQLHAAHAVRVDNERRSKVDGRPIRLGHAHNGQPEKPLELSSA